MSDPTFSISLSSCYNYTQNYKKNTLQAKRHHDGRGINACISLHQPPRIGVAKFVLNLHWSSSNVNFFVDQADEHSESTFVDSKDAKTIVPGDITPVQKPMKTWKQRDGILPDHDWEQGRANAVTPMAHLFLETLYPEQLNLTLSTPSSGISVTRSGKAINLIYLSHYEPETVFRQLNEILLLMVQPGLDVYFRNPNTGKLKENFTFIVDNGPSEQPSSIMVQMSLVRLCKFLKLNRVVQVSFAEYHSKRNFVERVHPQVNKALSDHGPFCSYSKHPNTRGPGKEEHRENMEEMASDAIECIRQAKFGGKHLDVFRGLKEKQWVFTDESNSKEFLSLSEANKEISELSYNVNHSSPLLKSLHDVWGIDPDFNGSIYEDYKVIKDEQNTCCWGDKYTTIIYGDECTAGLNLNTDKFHRQPLPDFPRWLESGGELHYLPYELRCSLPQGEWDGVPGCFLPSHILDLAFLVIPEPLPSVCQCLALLSWTTQEEVQKYYKEKKEYMEKDMEDNLKRDQWRMHSLYTSSKEQLTKMCKERNIEITGKKFELVERLSLSREEEAPQQVHIYTGGQIPTTTKELGKLPRSYLKSILRWYGLPTVGTKDSILLNVLLIAQQRSHLCFRRERKMLLELVSMVKTLILAEKKQLLDLKTTTPVYRHRTFLTPTTSHLSSTRPRQSASIQSLHSSSSRVTVPDGTTLDNIENLFKDVISHIIIVNNTESMDTCEPKLSSSTSVPSNLEPLETLLEPGARVKVLWTAEECQDTGWHEGWYLAVVKEVEDREEGLVQLQYVVEPRQLYTIHVKELLSTNKIKVHTGSELEQFFEVGGKVKILWTKKEVGDSNWRPGWYVAEVQQSDLDNDEISVTFQAESDVTYTYEVTPCVANGTLQMVKAVF